MKPLRILAATPRLKKGLVGNASFGYASLVPDNQRFPAMKLGLRILAVAIIAATSISLIGCAGPAGFSYQHVTITLSPMCEDCPNGIIYNPAYPVPVPASGGFGIGAGSAGGTAGSPGAPPRPGSVLLQPQAGPGAVFWFQADVTNAPANITWNIYPTPDLADITVLPSGTGATEGGTAGNTSSTNYGSFVSASGNVAYYNEGSGIPTYTGGPALQQALAMGIPQGDVLIQATVPSDPANPSTVATVNLLVQLFTPAGSPSVQMFPRTPTNPTGLTTSVATVPRGTNFQFTGYAVGAPPCLSPSACNNIYQNAPINTTDNTVVWLVGNANTTLGGVASATVGGLVNGVPGPYGTITQTGLYTAPAVIPISGFQPLIVLEAHANLGVTSLAALAYITIQ
jgi:hypothetical protein